MKTNTPKGITAENLSAFLELLSQLLPGIEEAMQISLKGMIYSLMKKLVRLVGVIYTNYPYKSI